MKNNKSESNSPQLPLILIVDDVPKNIQVLGSILEKEECEIAIATDGNQALELIDEVLPDLILLDIMMPGMDGYEVCDRIKAAPKTKDIPVIFLTALIETKDIVKGFQTGAIDYVTKPFHSTELLARVRTHLDLKKARDTQEKLISDLQDALSEIKTLRGILPICVKCKNIRDDHGYWKQIEEYIQNHTDAMFSHGICPKCEDKLYGDQEWYKKVVE